MLIAEVVVLRKSLKIFSTIVFSISYSFLIVNLFSLDSITAAANNNFGPVGNIKNDSPSLLKKPFEQFSDIVKQYSAMSDQSQIKSVAATAVAAAVATATAEHIAKQSNPTMGAKAAARAAEVADAVAKGDSERASKAVITCAKAVDEVIAFSSNRHSVVGNPNNKRILNSNTANNGASITSIHVTDNGGNDDVISRRRTTSSTRSSMCVVL